MSILSQAQTGGGASRKQLIIAGVLGLVAALLVVVYLSSQSDGGGSTRAVPDLRVVVAAQPIAAGDKITSDMLTTRELPQAAVAADALTDQALALGQVARYPVARGEQLVRSRLVEAPKVQALSFQIPPGLRGMTIPVSTNNTPAALLAPGDFVDVIVSVDAILLTGRAPTGAIVTAGRDLKGTATLLQNVQVLSVDRNYADTGVVYDASTRAAPPAEKDRVSFVTLAVTPDQAQLLWLAQDNGKLTLVLRPFGDDAVVPLTPRLEPLTLQ